MEIKRTDGAGDPASFTPEEPDSQTSEVSQPGIAGTFNEFTTEHAHGTQEPSVATYNGDLFSGTDSVGGYYGGDKIKIAQDDPPLDDSAATSRSTDDPDHKP